MIVYCVRVWSYVWIDTRGKYRNARGCVERISVVDQQFPLNFAPRIVSFFFVVFCFLSLCWLGLVRYDYDRYGYRVKCGFWSSFPSFFLTSSFLLLPSSFFAFSKTSFARPRHILFIRVRDAGSGGGEGRGNSGEGILVSALCRAVHIKGCSWILTGY